MDNRVSIIICTRNRSNSLRETLESIGHCEIPADLSAELLVIDNGSTDETKEVVRAARLPALTVRYVHEPSVGLCFARNRGLAECAGDVILFVDDDVRVPPSWIARMSGPIVAGDADAVAGGVRLAPYLERPWLRGFMRVLIASTDSLAANHEVQLIGANMAFSRRALEKVPGFDPELDAGALGFGGDALYSFQIEQAGLRLVPRWDVEVEHHCGDDRLNREGLATIARRMGCSRAYLCHHWEHRRVFAPRLAEWWVRLKLLIRRGVNVITSGGTEPTPWEVAYVTHAHFFRHYRVERRRPRNYNLRGLVKLRGLIDLPHKQEGRPR